MANPKPVKKAKPSVKKVAAPSAAGETRPPGRIIVAGVCVALVLVCAAIYGQTLRFPFVNYDDSLYVTENPQVQAGLTMKSVSWAFVTEKALYFHPLTWLSLMLDHSLYGMNAGGYHLTNLILHAGSCVLLFLALRLLTGALWPSAAVAALFAVHPLNVESVAWIAERKGVLSTFFWVLALGAYGLYLRRRGTLWYAAVAAAFVLGLMSKPMVVTFPFVLLLLDYWPLDRVDFAAPFNVMARKTARLAVEKIPLFLITLLSCVSTFVMQARGNNIDFGGRVSPLTRCANALVVYVIYVGQTLWPSGLAAFYPYPTRPVAQVAGAAVLLAAITLFCLHQARRRPYLIVGWLWYLGTLLPVIGLVGIGDFSHADRYTYIPLIGLFIMAAWGGADLAAAWHVPRRVLAFASGTVIGLLTVCAGVQAGYWNDTEALFRHAIAAGQESGVAYNGLGKCAMDQGRHDEARECLTKALALNPRFPGALVNLGKLDMDQGRDDEARECLSKALDMNPGYAYGSALTNMGALALDQGRYDEARNYLTKALDLNPNDVEVLYDLGLLAMNQEHHDEAAAFLKKVLDLDPQYVKAVNNLGVVAIDQRRYDDARTWLKRVLDLDPKNVNALYNMGLLAMKQDRYDEAGPWLTKALDLDPGNANVLSSLSTIAEAQGHHDEAKAYLAKALDSNPKDAKTLNSLGMIAVTQGRNEEARTYFTKALELDPKDAEVHYNLGVIAKGEKRYDEANAHLKTALELDPRHFKALNNLGVTAMEQGHNDEAVTWLKKALELKPDHINALINLGKIAIDQKRYDEADAHLKKALDLDPKCVLALTNLGVCLMLQEQYEEAQLPLKKALEIDPQHVISMKVLAAILAKSGRQEEGNEYLKKAAELEQTRAVGKQ